MSNANRVYISVSILALFMATAIISPLVAVGQPQPSSGPVTMPPPSVSSVSEVLSVHEYRYARDGETLAIEAWGTSKFLGSLIVSWEVGIVDFEYSDPAGGRFAAQTNIDTPQPSGVQPMFRLADLNSGEEGEGIWKPAEQPTGSGDGNWEISGNRSHAEAASFLTEREKKAALFIALVYEDALTNLDLRDKPKAGFEGLGPR